jgi:Gram-negative bacterial TonB protein C-terminal
MCQLKFNCKRTIFFLAISLIAFMIGVGFSKTRQVFIHPNAEIIETQSKVENIPEVSKINREVPGFKQLYTCEEINNYDSYKARNKVYVKGGILNGKSCFVEPIYPQEAIEKAISGQVNVEVLVDGFGVVRSAMAISGPELLRKSAVEAAYKTKVHPCWLGGEPVNVKGILVYKFILPE